MNSTKKNASKPISRERERERASSCDAQQFILADSNACKLGTSHGKVLGAAGSLLAQLVGMNALPLQVRVMSDVLPSRCQAKLRDFTCCLFAGSPADSLSAQQKRIRLTKL